MKTWTTYDGREIPINQMSRHHAWNTLRMLEKKGIDWMPAYARIERHLGEVSKSEEFWFKVRNFFWRVVHPTWRKK